MNWFAFSLISIFALAAAELTQQHVLNKKLSLPVRVSSSLTFLSQSLLTLPIIFLTDLRHEFFAVFNSNVFLQMLAVSFLGAIGMLLYFNSFKVKNISISMIFVSFSVVVSTMLGIIVFNESTTLLKFLGIAMVLIAIISLNIKNLTLERNHYFGLLAGIIIGTTYTFDKSIVLQIHPLLYIFWMFNFVALMSFLFNPPDFIKTIKTLPVNAYKLIFFSGIGYFLYNFATFTAYTKGGEVGRVDAINNSQVFLIILFEYFILKHTSGFLRKIITAIVAFCGVMILGLT